MKIINKIIATINEPIINNIINIIGNNKANRILYLNLINFTPFMLICDVFTNMKSAINIKA